MKFSNKPNNPGIHALFAAIGIAAMHKKTKQKKIGACKSASSIFLFLIVT
jgi:hypothetical protein